MDRRTSSDIERIDRMLVQCEQFIELGLVTEARSRARLAVATAERARRRAGTRPPDAALRARQLLAEDVARRAGASLRRHDGSLAVSSDDAVPESWL